MVRILNLLCDSEFGRIDQYLYPYYRKDVEQGRLTREEAKGLLADLCRFVNRDGLVWHQVVGGCGRDGKPSYNELTELVLENAPLFAHPHISLRVREDMPKELWEKAFAPSARDAGTPPWCGKISSSGIWNEPMGFRRRMPGILPSEAAPKS